MQFVRMSIVLLAATASFSAFAGDPPAAPATPATPPAHGPGFMAKAPASVVTTENTDNGVRLVFTAKDKKDVEALRAWAAQMADHLRQGCPMGAGHGAGPGAGMGAGSMGHGKGHGPGAQMGMQACPMMAAPAASTAPAKK